MLKSLRLKFILFNMLIVTVMLCIIFGLVLHFTYGQLERESIRTLQGISQRGGVPGRPEPQTNESRFPYFTLHLSSQGKLLSAQGSFFDLTDEALLQTLADRAIKGESTGVFSDYSLRYVRFESPMGIRITFGDISAEQATVKNLVRTCLMTGVLSLLVFLGLSILLSGWAVKPVAQAWKEQKQFIADASHELKTPLTVIMTNAELLQTEEYDNTEKKQFGENILTTARQMRALTESLLELARSDNQTVKAVYEKLDLSSVADMCVVTFEPVCYEKGLTLTATLQPEVAVTGSALQLQQCIDILLDNAVKYCVPGGEVRVNLAKQGSHCLLRVDNPGEEISKEDLKNIFKRFYRVDKARSRDGSFGLGLSIAQTHIRRHGGRIWAASREGINSFFIQLPLS